MPTDAGAPPKRCHRLLPNVLFESFLQFEGQQDFVIGRIPKAVCRELTTLSVTINLRPIVLFSARKPTRRHKYDQDEVRSIFSFILAAICNDYHLLLSSVCHSHAYACLTAATQRLAASVAHRRSARQRPFLPTKAIKEERTGRHKSINCLRPRKGREMRGCVDSNCKRCDVVPTW